MPGGVLEDVVFHPAYHGDVGLVRFVGLRWVAEGPDGLVELEEVGIGPEPEVDAVVGAVVGFHGVRSRYCLSR